MKVNLQLALNDTGIDANQTSTQRQLAISVSASGETIDRTVSLTNGEMIDRTVPLNLCLILDHSGSMTGKSLETVKTAVSSLVDRLSSKDRLSIVIFDHRAKVLVPNQLITDRESIKKQIKQLTADGGTKIDDGLRLGIEELAKGKQDTVSQAFLLTDGENEHGKNDLCLKFAQLAASYNLTLNTLGFGDNWNQDILEKIADAGMGTLSYIQHPDQAVSEFGRLFSRMQTVGLTNAQLLLSLTPNVRLAELKPIAQVSPDTIELPVQPESDGRLAVRLGDLMKDGERVVLVNIYVGQLPEGKQAIANIQVRYDDPAHNQVGLYSPNLPIYAHITGVYQPAPNPQVQQSVLALAKYRQTQLAETKLQQGDRAGAATMLQTAAKTALQMGDTSAATVLQVSATRLQAGEELSQSDRKKTRIVSKTVLQDASPQ